MQWYKKLLRENSANLSRAEELQTNINTHNIDNNESNSKIVDIDNNTLLLNCNNCSSVSEQSQTQLQIQPQTQKKHHEPETVVYCIKTNNDQMNKITVIQLKNNCSGTKAHNISVDMNTNTNTTIITSKCNDNVSASAINKKFSFKTFSFKKIFVSRRHDDCVHQQSACEKSDFLSTNQSIEKCGVNESDNAVVADSSDICGTKYNGNDGSLENKITPSTITEKKWYDCFIPTPKPPVRKAIKNIKRPKRFNKSQMAIKQRVSVLPSKVKLVEPDDFFEDPDQVRSHNLMKARLAEWVIIDIDDILDNGLGDPDIQGFADEEYPDHIATTKFCGDNEHYDKIEKIDEDQLLEDSFVQIERTPSVISLTTYVEDIYGIFYSPMPIVGQHIPEAWYYSLFDHDIQCGILYDHYSHTSAFREIKENTFRTQKSGLETTSDAILSLTEPLMKKREKNLESCYSSRNSLTEKVKSLSNGLLGPATKSKWVSNCLLTADTKAKCISIPRLFGLNEYDGIIINIDHIVEERGYGFLMKRKKQMYRCIEYGETIDENKLVKREPWIFVIKQFILEIFKGEIIK